MDETTVNSSSCADLERLAAAAATLGYSTDTISLPTHQVVNSNVNNEINLQSVNGLNSSTIHQYSSNAYDLSRPQQYTIRFADLHHENRNHHNINHHVISIPQNTEVPTTTRVGSNCSIIERSESNTLVIPRTQNFGQTVMTAKSINITQGASSVQYIPVDTRNFANSTDPLTIAVTQANSGSQIGNSQVINAQPVIHFIPQPPLQQNTPHSSQSMHQSVLLHHSHQPEQNQHHEPEQQQPNQPSQTQIPPQETKEKSFKPQSPKKKLIKKSKLKKKSSLRESENCEMERKTKCNLVIPDPVDINGKKYFVCDVCDEKFLRKYLFKRHQIFHTGEKRGALSLETKAKIINRIKCGEKQVDLAMEYNVGRSTLSFIMKNADKFLGVLQNGKFDPGSKRLRGAQREDVEAVLYEWYKQASQVGVAISGPILCRKAKDFALKLGYQEFKATHGWLDRFKRRKHIVLGRTKSVKEKDNDEETEEFKLDFADVILPNILMEYDSNDIFHASEIGLLYKVFPSKALQFKGTRCAGGTNSKRRITLLMCCNMTGSEKFPLLVVGKHAKPKCFRNVKSLPVQYIANEKSWMTKESFITWLHDLNSWFVQQNRKVLLVVPYLPVHPKAPKLSAVKVIVSPSDFVGPSKLGIARSLKKNYRRAVLESFLSHLEENFKIKKRGKKNIPFKLSLLSCLHKLAAAWHSVTDVTISYSFEKSALSKCNIWGINLSSENTLGTENLDLLHRLKTYGVNIPNNFTFDDYITFDDEVQVCHFMDDDDIIASVTGVDIESSDSDEESSEERASEENKENSEEEEEDNLCPPIEEVERNLALLRNYVTQQFRSSQEIIGILSHFEYLIQASAKSNASFNASKNQKEN